MSAFAFPLSHAPYVERELAAAMRRVGLDLALRADPDHRLAGLSMIDDADVHTDFVHRDGTLLVLVIEQDGRTITDVCAKCGLDRRRAEFYRVDCYPLAGYADDGLRYPPPAEDHEFVRAARPRDPAFPLDAPQETLL